MKNRLSITMVLMLVLLSLSFIAGCSHENDTTKSGKSPEAVSVKKEVTLYFGDNQAEYVVGEKRILSIKEPVTAEKTGSAIVRALIVGPQTKGLYKTLPAETRLLSLKIKNSIAYVDFSQEIISKHWGGSSGETMTINSIVNSLTELKEIKKVQILVEGKVQESLLGHWDTSSPIARDEAMIKR